jgi:hypothetical protein
MQAGLPKAERIANRADRALIRAIMKEVAIARESVKRPAASPAVIALTKAAYKNQCLAFETSEKETEDVSSNG